MLLTAFSNQPLGFRLHLTRQYLSAILWYPYQVLRHRLVGLPGFPHLHHWLIHTTIVP